MDQMMHVHASKANRRGPFIKPPILPIDSDYAWGMAAERDASKVPAIKGERKKAPEGTGARGDSRDAFRRVVLKNLFALRDWACPEITAVIHRGAGCPYVRHIGGRSSVTLQQYGSHGIFRFLHEDQLIL